MPIIIVIVMFILGMAVMVMAIMGVRVERAAFTEFNPGQTVTVDQGHRCRLRCDSFNGSFQKGFQILADPEDKVGLLKLARLRRLQGIAVRRSGPLDDQSRCANALHHRGNQRMHRFDRGYDVHICRGHAGASRKQ